MKLNRPFNYDNFCKMQTEIEELKDVILMLNSKLHLVETKPAVKAKPTAKKEK
jgi:hypothetical protein